MSSVATTTNEKPATTYAEAVGATVRCYRREYSLTLEVIAEAGRKFGSSWSASSISNIERGRASLTLPLLITLALALGHLSGEPIRLVDLIGDADLLAGPFLSDHDRPARRSFVERALSGYPLELTEADCGQVAAAAPERNDQSSADVSLATLRAAQKLGIASGDLHQLALKRWGHSLPAEAWRRAGAASSPQSRGRVTRVLVHELQESPGFRS